MIKKLRIYCLVIVLITIGLAVYGKIKVTNYDFEDYIANTRYDTTQNANEMLDYAPYLKKIINDDKINDYTDLLDHTKYCLDVKVEKSKFSGEGIINYCVVERVIKGEKIEIGDKIGIYDLVFLLARSGTVYGEGARPLKTGEKYRVFIDNAINPLIDGAYLFSSFKYGSFRLNPGTGAKLEQNTDEKEITLKDAMEFDCITRDGDMKIYNDIYNEINN
ncbi:hypothetical protein [Thomasclavelia sp.]|uniref:hypothetical protein n=1 Tax=Thomasclavelia sp. TaxID=3025757 RepID=UPI0026015F4D|nr:hypothetical protein [Thomasclavelia sp.]